MARQQAVVAGGVDQAFVDEFAERYFGAWNAGDVEALLDVLAEEIIWDDTAWPTTIYGHAEAREFFESTLRAFPDTRLELVDTPFIHPTEPKAAFHWKMSATNTGPIDPPGLRPTGKPLEIDGADFHEYDGGKLVRLRVVFDMATAMRQIGALPDSGTVAERALVFLNNLQTRLPL